jgi:molecular chaperone DnaK
VYTAEKSLADYKDKVGEEVKHEVQEKIDALKKVKDGTDYGAIRSASEELSRALSKIGEAMSKQDETKKADDTKKDGGEDEPKVRDAETE